MFKLLRIPNVQMLIILLFIFSGSLFKFPPVQSLYVLTLSVFFIVLFDVVFTFLTKRKFALSDASFITAIIIALLINPSSSWYEIASVCFIASILKHFLRPGKRHIFNPAASGLFFGSLLFNRSLILWQGASYQSLLPFSFQNLIFFLFLLLPGFVSLIRVRRYVSIISFLIVYSFFLVSQSSSLAGIIDPLIIFFALVMLPEPMTSPVNIRRQVLYGVFIAIFYQILLMPKINTTVSQGVFIPDALLLALLLGNGLFFRYK